MIHTLLVLVQISHAVSRQFYTNPNANPFGDFALGSGFDMTRYEPTGNHVFLEGAESITYDIMPITNSQTRCALVTSAKELTDKLKVHGEISVTYNMITGSGFVTFDQKEEKMRRKSYYTCTIDRTLFTVSVNAPEITKAMTPEEKEKYLPPSLVWEEDPAVIQQRIGDYHVKSITYGRRYQTEVELTYTNEDTYQKIAGELEAKIGVGALSVSAKVSVELEAKNKEEDFSMVIASEAFGFLEAEPLFLPSTDKDGKTVEQQVEEMISKNLDAFNKADDNSTLKAETGLKKSALFNRLGDAYPLSYTIAPNDPYYDNTPLSDLEEQMLVKHVDLAYDIKRELEDLQITIEQRAERLFENYHLLSGVTELSIQFLKVRQQITDEILELHAEVNDYLNQMPREIAAKDVYVWAREARADGFDRKLEHITLDIYATEVWQLMGMEDADMEDVNPVGTTCLFNGIQATMDRNLETEHQLKFAGRVIFGDKTVRHVLFDINGTVVSLGFIDHTHEISRPLDCPGEIGETCHELVFVREDCTLLRKGDAVWFNEGRYTIDNIGSDEHIIRGHVVKEKLTHIRIQIISQDADRDMKVVLTGEDIKGVTLRGAHSSYDLTTDIPNRLMYSHGYVCDSAGFSQQEAKMVCTHMGYSSLLDFHTGQKIPTSNAWGRPFVTLWDLECEKNAMELSDCDYKTGELGPEDWDKCGSRNGIFILCSDEEMMEDDVKIDIETVNGDGCVLQNWQGKKDPEEVCSGGSSDRLDAIANVQIQGNVCLVMYQFAEVQCVIRGEDGETYDMTEESVHNSWCYNSFHSDMFPDELELVSLYPKGNGECLDREAKLAELEYLELKTCAQGEEQGYCSEATLRERTSEDSAQTNSTDTSQSSEEQTSEVSEEMLKRDLETFRNLCIKTCKFCPEVVSPQYYTMKVIAEESSVLLHNETDPIPVKISLLVDNNHFSTKTFGGAEIHSFGDHMCGSKIELIFEPEDLYDHGEVVCEARGVRGIRMENNIGFVSGEVEVTFSCRFPPSASPSHRPSVNPSTSPSVAPHNPTESPTRSPIAPSESPTSSAPSKLPSASPTSPAPSKLPSESPTTDSPSNSPTPGSPSNSPTKPFVNELGGADVLLMKLKGGSDVFDYESAYWTDGNLLHPSELVASDSDDVDAKLQAFLDQPISALKLCYETLSNCYVYELDQTYNSARDLFSGSYVRSTNIGYGSGSSADGKQQFTDVFLPPATGDATLQLWYDDFWNGGHGHGCNMQRPGINTQCNDNNWARIGYCVNLPDQVCQQSDGDDADASIGFGLKTQNEPKAINAPFGEYFLHGIGIGTLQTLFYHQGWLFATSDSAGSSSAAQECVDTNYGGLDNADDGCSWYEGRESACGMYDDHDFVANEMCCVCGGGSY